MRALVAILAALAVLAVPAQADEVPSGAKCEWSLKKKHRLASVLKRGLPIKVTCDGPASVDALFDWDFKTKQDHKWMLLHPGGIPGISTGLPAELKKAGTVTLRVRFTREAARFVRRYARTRLAVIYGMEKPDDPGVFRGVGGKDVLLVR